jgi:hypothetical protein
METLPWYKSAIVRQQIVQLVAALVALVGINTGGIDLDATVASIFGGIAAVIAVWTLLTRIFKPAPNLSQTAAAKEVELVVRGDIPAQNPTQRGFARPGVMLLLAALATVATIAISSGCAGTTSAYKAAQSLPDTAYVVTEHYAAVLNEATGIASQPDVPAEVKAALQKAAAAVQPIVRGDPATGQPSLHELATRYQSVRDAKSEAELQDALNRAIETLANFINAVKSARR